MKNAPSGASLRAAILTCATMCAVSTVHAQNGTWIGVTTGTNWSDPVNWADLNADTIGDVADGSGNTADLTTTDVPGGAFVVNLDTARTIGNISFGDGAAATASTWTISGANILTLAGAAPTLTTNVSAAITSVVAGSSGLTKNGTGILTLSGTNTFTGPVNVNSGILAVNNNVGAGPATNPINLADQTTLSLLRISSSTSIFVGNPSTVAAGSTIYMISNQAGNGYSGLVNGDAASTVQIGNTGALVQVSFSTGTEQFASFLGTVRVSDGGSLRFSASSNLNNGGVNTTFDTLATGDIATRNGGTVHLGALTGSGFVSGSGGATGTAVFSIGGKGTDSTFGGIIRDGNAATNRFAAVTKVGAGKLTLTGANTYTGATNVTLGTLEIGDGGLTGALGTTATAVTAGANLVFNTSGTQVMPGAISGAGNITKKGSGRVSFSGVNSYTANTLIEGGELAINADTGLGNVANAVNFATGSGKLVSDAAGVITARAMNVAAGATGGFGAVEATDSLQVDGLVSGAGGIEIGGAGVVTLTNANAYLGTTNIVSGTLAANNTGGSATSSAAVTVSGGSLGGTGTIAGAVSVASGAHLRPGAITPTSSGVESLSVGSLNLAGGSTLDIEFANSSSYDTVVVANPGGLTTSGASVATPVLVDIRQENSVANFATLGTYNLIQYSGTFTGNANDLFEVTAGSKQAGVTYTFGATGGFITLTLAGTAPPVWNVDADGTWATAGNWANGIPNASGANAIFGSAISQPRTITLGAPATVGTLTFNNANRYTIGGASTLTLNNGTSNAIATILLGNHTISAPVALSRPLDLLLSHATDSLDLTGVLSGTVGINKSSVGNLTLGGNNTLFSGPVNFSDGTLKFASGGLGTGSLTLDDATLEWAAGNTQDISPRTINFGNGTVTFNTGGNNVVLANDIGNQGTASFIKTGEGKLTLVAETGFLGNITISGGSLQLGNGGTTGSVLGEILNNGELRIAHSGDFLFTNPVSGTGSLVQQGPGNLQIAAANTFTGPTTITGGAIMLFSGMGLQNSTLIYNNGDGLLDLDLNVGASLGGLEGNKGLALMNFNSQPVALTIGGNGQATTYSGALSGDGSLVKTGTGVTILTGANIYTGATTVTGGNATGALELDQGGSITGGALTVTGNSRFTVFDGSYTTTTVSNVTNAGTTTATFEIFGGTSTFSGGLNAAGNMNIPYLISAPGGTLNASSMTLGRTSQSITLEPTAGINTAGLFINGGAVNITGNLLLGSGSATNSTVNVKMDSGSLTVGGSLTIGLNNGGRWSVLDVNGGTLSSTDAVTGIQLGGAQVGNAILLINSGIATAERIQFGQGTNAGTHVLRIANGALYVGAGGLVDGSTADASFIRLTGGLLGAKAAWSTTLPIELTNAPVIKAADGSGAAQDITLTGAVTGAGSLEKTGDGILTLGGTYAYTGATTVSDGTLTLPTATLSDTASVEIKTGAVLNLTHNTTDNVKGFLIDGVSQATGTWGRIGSPTAAHTTALITGDGILNVQPDDAFTGWIAGFPSLSGASAEKGADPDGDGLTNLEEFAFDGEPDNGAASGKIRSRIETVGTEQALVLTLPVRNGASFDNVPGPGLDATVDKLAYVIQGSNNLVNFDQAVTEIPASTTNMPTLSTGWTYRSFRLNGALPTRGSKGFMAATATEAP